MIVDLTHTHLKTRLLPLLHIVLVMFNVFMASITVFRFILGKPEYIFSVTLRYQRGTPYTDNLDALNLSSPFAF